jgi:Putative zinc-finger
MNCVEVGALQEALHDGALDSEIMKRVEDHLSACPSCGAELARLRIVSDLLQRSRIPAPSPSLDVRLMSAFVRKQQKLARARFTWSRAFIGSVSIPKPALLMAAVIIAIAIVAAVKVGMITSTPIIVETALPTGASPRPQDGVPGAAEKMKIVEVPVVREKVRTIYVDERHRDGGRRQNMLTDMSSRGHDPAMSSSVGEKGYFTRANLLGFLPSGEMRTRIISEVKTNEK